MPQLVDADVENERIIKEYIDGDTVFALVKNGQMRDDYMAQVKNMCALLYPVNINIDYFPRNFIVQNGLLYYIDFECNDYMPKWNFENWGIKYWSETPEFMKYLAENGT